jgi:glycosyltransferase involved in cell wall biosynthesis
MKKIFFACTHANQGTGYGRVANKITNFLADHYEIVFLAFQNYPGQAIEDRFIDPRIRFIDALKEDPDSPKGFGDKCIKSNFDTEKPDILFLYNDLPVCEAIIKLIDPPETCKVVLYLDIVYPWEDIYRFEYLKSKTHLCLTFLDCWKKHMIEDLGWDQKKVKVLKHGVDMDRFKLLDSAACKEHIGFKSSDFLVLNLNRNSYRKQWCVTIKAFMEFLELNSFDPRIKLICGCILKTEDGYDIIQLIDIECMKRKLDPEKIKNNHIFTTFKPLHAPEEYINKLYNACDVGMNTCCGEGFGLTTAEHACFGKPQVISGVPALVETLGLFASVIPPTTITTMSRFENHGGEIAHFNPSHFAKALNEIFHEPPDKIYEIPHFPWVLEPLAESLCAI